MKTITKEELETLIKNLESISTQKAIDESKGHRETVTCNFDLRAKYFNRLNDWLKYDDKDKWTDNYVKYDSNTNEATLNE